MKPNFEHLVQKHDYKCLAEWFLNSKKPSEVWKSWDLLRSHDIRHGGYGKNWTHSHNLSCMMFINRSVSEEES